MSNIKKINFKKNIFLNKNSNESNENLKIIDSNDNNENSIKSIIFNENENENLNVMLNDNEENINELLKTNQKIDIKEEIAIENNKIIYKDDNIYTEDLINKLLSEYPVLKQNDISLQKFIEKKTKDIINTKNFGLKKYNQLNQNIEYELVEKLLKSDFNNSRIIPIVINKHVVYSELLENNVNINNNTGIKTSSDENENGLMKNNLIDQLKNLKQLYHEKSLKNHINYNDFLNKYYELVSPYLKNNDSVSILKNAKASTLILRYFDFDNILWNTINTDNDFIISIDKFNEIGKIIGIEDSVLINGSDINIVGFFVIGSDNDYNTIEKKLINKEITNIINKDKNILIESRDHNLTKNDFFWIKNSNSTPNINGYYYNDTFNIINKDTIELKIEKKLINNGDFADLFINSKLEYDLYQILKNDEKLEITKIDSKYKNESNNNNKIYLFNNTNIDLNDYNYILKKITPNLNEILENEKDNLKNITTFDDINNIISKYSININDFQKNQIDFIKNKLKNNLDKIKITFNENIKKNYLKKNIDFENSDFFLSNKYINNKLIEEIYGEYPHLNKIEDSFYLRLKWVENQNDNGEIFYLNYMRINKNIIDKNYIEEKIKEIENTLNELKVNFEKEKNQNSNKNKIYKYQAYVVTEKDKANNYKNLKRILLDDTVIFENDNLFLWKDGKKNNFEDIEEDTLALVNKNIWIWKNNKWEKTDAISKYDNIKNLCEFNNIDLSDFKLDSLDCIYRKNIGCHTKKYIRLYENIKSYTDSLAKFKLLNESINNNNDEILNQINLLKKKYFTKIHFNSILENNKENDSKEDDTKKDEIIKDDLYKILLKLKNIKNYYEKLDLIFLLISIDGILIDDVYYSKKFKRKMDICGHYKYLKMIHETNDINIREDIKNNLLLTNYGDNGESEKNLIRCTKCGEFLFNNDYDETEGFADSGALKMSRTSWVYKEEIVIDEIDKLTLDLEDIGKFLIKKGLVVENLDLAKKIAKFITNGLYVKCGVKLSNSILIDVIIESLQKIKKIQSFSIFEKHEKKKLFNSGKYSKDRIEKLNFRERYKSYHSISFYTIITSRFLISVQTIIPPLKRINVSDICAFNSFYGEDGFNYLACILNEMKIEPLQNYNIENLKLYLKISYDDFKNKIHIKKIFKEKEEYNKSIENKISKFKQYNTLNLFKSELIEPKKIDNFEKIFENKKYENIYKNRNNLYLRLNYLSRKIIKTVNDVISKSNITDIITPILESSCCLESVDEYQNYYSYIKDNSNEELNLIIEESKDLYKFLKYYINSGSIHRFQLYDINKFDGIYNNAIIDNEENTNQEIIKKVFETFVDSGEYEGTQREYIEDVDIKTGKSREDIISKNYTIDEYKTLLKAIENLNIKFLEKPKESIIHDNLLNQLINNSSNDLENLINNLINRVKNNLNKDENFTDKYLKLVRNFGNFNNNDNTNTNQILKKKIDYIKKFYTSKLRKYLSIIKNNRNIKKNNFKGKNILSDLDNVQKFIFSENSKLDEFLNNSDIQKYFVDLNLEYTNEQINSINGSADIPDINNNSIKTFSDFSFNQASNVLLYILVKELNNFFTNSTNNNSTIKNNYIAKFILLLLEELNEDNELFKLCDTNIIKNQLEKRKIEYIVKIYSEKDKSSIEEKEELINGVEKELEFLEDKKYVDDDTEKNISGDGEDGIDITKEEEEEIQKNLSAGSKLDDVGDVGYGEFGDFENGDGFNYELEE